MRNNLVIKANQLNESRYKLTLQEQRVILVMISLIKPTDIDFQEYDFSIKEFMKAADIKGKSVYSEMKKVTRSLLSKSFVIPEPSGDLQIGWVSSAKYHSEGGKVSVCFDPKLKPYLLALKKGFTRYQLKNVIRLRSIYAVRLYELLKQYQGIGSRYFELNELRLLLGIHDKKYSLYGNLKARVLERAKREMINTDIKFTYEPIKAGRRVAGLNFNIFKNAPVVKKSYKSKGKARAKKSQGPTIQDIEQKEAEKINQQLVFLEESYPGRFKALKSQAQKRLAKKDLTGPGSRLKVRFKMGSLLPGFLQKHKIEF